MNGNFFDGLSSLITPTTYYIVRGILDLIVLAIMIYASIDDVKTRYVKPRFQISLLVIAVINLGFQFFAFPGDIWGHAMSCLLSGIGMFVLYITLVLVFKSGIGGADTKVSSTMALYLGLSESIIMMLMHLVAALGYSAFSKAVMKKHVASVPLMIFILIGYVVARATFWIPVALGTMA